MIWREDYRPYGERLTNAPAAADNKVWFTSRRQDPETGLVYMGARFYDPVAGRFLSKDPVHFVEDNVHSFNRYAYANNNPYKYVDPDGRSAVSAIAREVLRQSGGGYALGVVADAVSQKLAFGSVDWGLAATSSAAAAGGSAGLFSGIFAGAASASKGAAAATDFFAGTRYTDKVIVQMGRGDHHGFPESVKAFQDSGAVTKITGGDGVVREMLRIPGEYGGKRGAFEFIKEADGAINHRLFNKVIE